MEVLAVWLLAFWTPWLLWAWQPMAMALDMTTESLHRKSLTESRFLDQSVLIEQLFSYTYPKSFEGIRNFAHMRNDEN